MYLRDAPGTHPPLDSPAYKSTALRHPSQRPVLLPQKLTEITGPLLGEGRLGPNDNDLTAHHAGEPQGQRIIVHGRLLDDNGIPVSNSLVEIWQANAGGRYKHVRDRWPSPVDPYFDGVGRTLTDAEGRYTFTTIKPGAYPWQNHDNAWRPAHIHFSVFGRSFTQRLVTQMYFPDDPLFGQDPIFNSVPDPAARARMISSFDMSRTVANWALAYSFDIVLRGRDATPFEEEVDDE
ncbi:protocatechuate 3,4-dioxygenase subunit beta [Actinosynnema sp. ALI-1.44]|uniref:protocatechuate 3,4-dioxygenase subunit beta n=1 Tax=Actinosynnema sp. ALI-1.44 TaxID=1933779 RepID=UPI00097C9981|nr:protocatechuate 3,4-dioxygenase subunit beta [Actinosynnema sp. ALI-1.44]ONI70774.1 protocatechuate 3,4-dioxygenase subunit beta [Actinosynnema sp. ALI-1.44]